MGRAREASVAVITCARTGLFPNGRSNLWRPAPMRLELPAARMIAANEPDVDISYAPFLMVPEQGRVLVTVLAIYIMV
jgi:hypothetical protein